MVETQKNSFKGNANAWILWDDWQLVSMREGPDVLLSPRTLHVYWTAFGVPVDGFAFAFLSFIYQGM